MMERSRKKLAKHVKQAKRNHLAKPLRSWRCLQRTTACLVQVPFVDTNGSKSSGFNAAQNGKQKKPRIKVRLSSSVTR
jgi:hypothetical protein